MEHRLRHRVFSLERTELKYVFEQPCPYPIHDKRPERVAVEV